MKEEADGYPEGYPKVFWAALVAGWAVIGFGLVGLFDNADARMSTNPRGWGLLFVQSGLAHDLVLTPVVVAVGWAVARTVGRRIRPAVQSGLVVSGVVALFSLPLVRRWGEKPANPTILPRDYGRGLLLVLAAVWVATALAAVWQWRRRAAVTPPSDPVTEPS